MTQFQRRALILFVVALALRLLIVVFMRDMGIGLDDMFQYDMLARSILNGDGYRWYAEPDLALIQQYFTFDLNSVEYDPRGVLTSFRPPLYPAFLSLVYFFSGIDESRFFIARIVQTFLNAALAPLAYLFARKLFPTRERIAWVAGWLIVFYPMLVIYPLALATENLFFILFLGTFATLALAAESRKTGFFLLAGLFMGLTALTRSVSLVTAGLVILWTFFILREWRKAIYMALTVLLVISPWIIRNSLLHQRFVGIESAMGYTLYVSFHPESTGTFQYGISLDLIPMLDDGQRDLLGREKGWEFIRADPVRAAVTLPIFRAGHFLGLERRALTYFYSNNFFGYLPFPALLGASTLLLLPFVILLPSAAFGLALIRWDKKTLLMAIALLGYSLPHVVLLAEERFHYTLIPFFAILASFCWQGGFAALRERWQTPTGKLALLLALTAVLLMFFNWGAELNYDREKLLLLFGPEGNLAAFPY